MVHQTVDVPFCRNTGVGLPGIGADGRSLFHPFRDQGEEGALINFIDDFGPDLPVPAEDPEDGLLRGPPPSPGSCIPNHLPFIPPGSTEVCFIHLHRTGEGLRHFPGEDQPDLCECPEHSLLVKPGLFDDGIRALFHQEQVEDLPPFFPRKPEGEPMGSELVFALSAPSPARPHFV